MGASNSLGLKVFCATACVLSMAFVLSAPAYSCAIVATWTEPVLLTDTSDVYIDSDISIGKNNVYAVSWAYDSGPVYLFRSPDGGVTWDTKDVFGYGVFRGEPGMCVYSDGVDDTVLLATTGSIYRSVDNGDNFEPLSSLALSDGALWWRFMEVYTNGSWFGRAVDDNIYTVGSQAFGVPWEGGHYVVSFCRSSDAGVTWDEPAVICDMTRDTAYPELVCDGERLFVFYTTVNGDYTDLYVRHSDDWGQTWSDEEVLMPHRGTGWVCPHSVQDIGAGRALLAMGDYVSVADLDLGMEPYGRYGYFHYDDSTFEEVGNVTGDDWDVSGGFSAALTYDNDLLVAWAKSDGHPYNRIWFTSSEDSGLCHAYGRPWIISSPDLDEGAGNEYTYSAEALEADMGANDWSVRTDASWLSTASEDDTSCVLSGTPDAEGIYWVNVTVSDDNSTDSINYTIMVTAGSTAVPEFSTALVPVVGTVAVVATLVLLRRRTPGSPR